MSDRNAAVAGSFYDADAAVLRTKVTALLASQPGSGPTPKAIIAPHAGHQYSGAVAAHAYAHLGSTADSIRRVVILGPSHRVGFRGIATTDAEHYLTPLGPVPIAKVSQALGDLPYVKCLNQAHTQEHSIEVHLPFLQVELGTFELVPLVVGDASADEVAGVLERLWGGDDTLIVVSTDLSHFLSYNSAQVTDHDTAEKICARHDAFSGDQACGARPLNGLMRVATERGLSVRQVEVCNSGDTAGDKQRVVGYGAWLLVAPPLTPSEQAALLQVARDAITQPLNGAHDYRVRLSAHDATLREPGASFVTLNLAGRLRGCIGSLAAHQPLVVDVAKNAQSAAFRDPRFAPLTLAEWASISVHISVLSPPEPINVSSREALLKVLRPGVDGLILEDGIHRATYLPSVWEQLPEPDRFVTELRRKAGLPGEGWHTGTRLQRYSTFEFSAPPAAV